MARRWVAVLTAVAVVVVLAILFLADLPFPRAAETPEESTGPSVPVDESAPAAPEFSGTLIDGNEFSIADVWDDRPVVLVFTAGWCEHCAVLHQELDEVVAEYDGVVELVGVADEEDAEIEQYVADLGIRRPLVLVPIEVWDTYAVSEAPLVALVGPGGKLLRGWPGGVDPDVLREQLDALVPSDG